MIKLLFDFKEEYLSKVLGPSQSEMVVATSIFCDRSVAPTAFNPNQSKMVVATP